MAEDKKQSTKTPPVTPPVAEGPPVDPNEGPGKGKAFFDRAKTVAATGNFDYAIDMYIEGLNKEPFNVDEHRALREVAMRRKLGGAKAGGGLLGLGGIKGPYKGKTPKEALLNNEFILAKDVGNITAMVAMIRNADILKLKDLILWLGQLIKEANRTSKVPKVELYIELADIFEKHEEYARACEAIAAAMELKPLDMELAAKANHYAAQETIKRGKYGADGSFKESIKDKDQTKERLQEESLAKSAEYLAKMLAQAKADYLANPKELQVISKYAKALQEMDEEKYENEAMELLRSAFESTRIYRLKAVAGDIRMKQYRRDLRMLREAVKADPADKEMLHQFEVLNKERLAFELAEYEERALNMPTDMGVRYELGVRFWELKRYDEAIAAFQEAQANPKHRTEALHLLGRSFLIQGMKPEAVDTLKRAIDEYDLASTGNKKALELYYWYGRSLESNRKTQEAVDVYSKLIRWDISYLDARKRLGDLRAELGV